MKKCAMMIEAKHNDLLVHAQPCHHEAESYVGPVPMCPAHVEKHLAPYGPNASPTMRALAPRVLSIEEYEIEQVKRELGAEDYFSSGKSADDLVEAMKYAFNDMYKNPAHPAQDSDISDEPDPEDIAAIESLAPEKR